MKIQDALIVTKYESNAELNEYNIILLADEYPYSIAFKNIGDDCFSIDKNNLEKIKDIIEKAYECGKSGNELEIIENTEEN